MMVTDKVEKIDGDASAQHAVSVPPNIDRLLKYLPFMTVAHFVIGMPALIASLALAYFAFVQADATQKMQVGGAMPFVTIGTSNANERGEPEISIGFSNNGVGPAIMGPIEISYNGRRAGTPLELLQQCCGLDEANDVSFATSPASDIAVRPGENVDFLRIPRNKRNDSVWARLNDERWKFRIRSCYCSIFNDCWVTEGMQALPRPVGQCPKNWTIYRENVPRPLEPEKAINEPPPS